MPRESTEAAVARTMKALAERDRAVRRGEPALPLAIPRSPLGEQLARGPRQPEILSNRESMVRGMTGRQEAQEKAGGSLGSLGGIASTAGSHALNSAMFGHLPNVMGAVGGAGMEELSRADLEASSRLHPTAAGVGEFGGAFAPGGGTLSTLAARGGAGLVRPLARAIEGTGPKLEHVLARRATARLTQNAAGGSSALLSYNLLNDREQRNSLAERLQDAVEQIQSPIHLGLTGTATMLQAKLGREIDREMLSAGMRMERETGVKLPVETFFSSSASRGTYQTLAQLPGRIRHRVSKMENKVVAAIEEELDAVAKRATGHGYDRNRIASATSAPAAASLRRISGVAEERKPGVLQERASDAYASGVSTVSGGLDALVPMADMRVLRKAIADMRSTRPNTEGSRLEPVFRKLEKLTTLKTPQGTMHTPITLRDMEGLKKTLGFYRKFKDLIGTKPQDRTRYEAGQLYDVVQAIEARAFPDFANAVDDVSKLKKMQEALPQRATIDVDDGVVAEFFKPGPGILKRWEAAETHSMPGDLDVLRGWYFTSLMDAATAGKNGSLSAEALRAEFNKPRGRFNRQVFDRIIPGGESIRRELLERAKLHERLMGDTRLATAGAKGGMALGVGTTLAGAGGAAATAAWLLSNPYTAVPLVLGPLALQVYVTRSLVGGRMENALRRASTGTAQIGPSAVAAQQAFGGVPPRELPNLPLRVPNTGQ